MAGKELNFWRYLWRRNFIFLGEGENLGFQILVIGGNHILLNYSKLKNFNSPMLNGLFWFLEGVSFVSSLSSDISPGTLSPFLVFFFFLYCSWNLFRVSWQLIIILVGELILHFLPALLQIFFVSSQVKISYPVWIIGTSLSHSSSFYSCYYIIMYGEITEYSEWNFDSFLWLPSLHVCTWKKFHITYEENSETCPFFFKLWFNLNWRLALLLMIPFSSFCRRRLLYTQLLKSTVSFAGLTLMEILIHSSR